MSSGKPCSISAQKPHQISADEAYATIYVEAHAARGHHRLGVGHVERCHIADGKAIAGVHIRQCNRLLSTGTNIIGTIR
jgi:hypothetical protein